MSVRKTSATVDILSMRRICKTFAGVQALRDVDLSVRTGEIHAIVGENGAGKSTLMKVLSGVYPHGSYSGDIFFEGQLQRFAGVRDSERQGIIIIHQELALVPQLSIAENLFLGHEPAHAGVVDHYAQHQQAHTLLQRVGLDASPRIQVDQLGIGQQQLVEIAKALAKRVKLLILDEPTASLSEVDSAALLRLLCELRDQGVTSVLITHKLHEVMQIADQVTVIRDGRTIETLDRSLIAVDEDRLIRGMVGRDMANRYPHRQPQIGSTFFEVRNWYVRDPHHPQRDRIRNVSFHVKQGEIVGIAGPWARVAPNWP